MVVPGQDSGRILDSRSYDRGFESSHWYREEKNILRINALAYFAGIPMAKGLVYTQVRFRIKPASFTVKTKLFCSYNWPSLMK
jgi:hypothetical protein